LLDLKIFNFALIPGGERANSSTTSSTTNSCHSPHVRSIRKRHK
jgi:hypothetical protein